MRFEIRKGQYGLVAILDALGAADFSEAEVKRFIESRALVLELSTRKEEIRGALNAAKLRVFTFNDTILIVYETNKKTSLDDWEAFASLLRRFFVESLKNGILFRGSLSSGQLYKVDDETNTVMGPAVSDAAAWYDRADWLGINATPHATIHVQSLLTNEDDISHVLCNYAVPFKDREPLHLRALNWPKAFYVKGIRPQVDGQSGRSMLMTLLSRHQVPKGSESKYFNAITYFDHVAKTQKLVKTPQS